MFGNKKENDKTSNIDLKLNKLVEDVTHLLNHLRSLSGDGYYYNSEKSESTKLYDAYMNVMRILNEDNVYRYRIPKTYFKVYEGDESTIYEYPSIIDGETEAPVVQTYKVLDNGTLILTFNDFDGTTSFEFTGKYTAGNWIKITEIEEHEYVLTDLQKETLLKCKFVLKSCGVTL